MDTAETLDRLLNAHTLNESRNTLSVTRATAGELCINYDIVLDIKIDLLGAYALSFVSNVLHNCI